MVMKYLKTFFLIIMFTSVALPVFAATQQLETPEPYIEGEFTAAWDRVSHASSYEVKITMRSTDSGKTVTRSLNTTLNRLDLSVFAAGNEVSFAVRAVASSGNSSKYRSSYWGECDEFIVPNDSNEVFGFAGISSGRLFLEDENGTRMTGWKKINGSWYYFNPAENGMAVTGWAEIDGRTYLFGDYGKMCTGWQAWNGHWYYLDSQEGFMFTGWRQVTPNNPYYFTENATAAQPYGSLDEAITTAAYPGSKPPYTLPRSTEGGSTPAPGGGQSGSTSAQTADQWKTNPDGSWSFLKNGSPIKNSWEKIGGFWYYFNNRGIMLTGWQYINYRWYYLEPTAGGRNGYKQGAMWVNAITPDGYKVNEDGCWVQNGEVVTTANPGNGNSSSQGNTSKGNTSQGGTSRPDSGNGSASAQLSQITNCHVTLSLGDAVPGKCRTAAVTGANYCKVKNVSYSKPQENWIAGETITITAELEAESGYMFSAKTKFSCNNATLLSQTGTSNARTVKFEYIPVMKLEAPTTLYVNDSCELRWAPSAMATRYKVVLSGGEGGNSTLYVTEPGVDLYQYGDIDSMTINATVSALREEGSKCYLESDKVTVNDLGTYRQTHTLNGTFERREGRLRFRMEDGSYATGWQNLAGTWYHFRTTGASDGPGWYQDSTGYWYYFDSSFRMMTGTLNEGGKTYILNDGRRPDLPMGAWIQ